MNNHAHRLDYLYRQYIQKACTWEELQEFFDYVADPAWQEQLMWLADQHMEELSVPEEPPSIDWEYMYRQIIPQAANSRVGAMHHKQRGLIRRMLVRYSVAAAMLILVLGLAGYHFLVADKEGDAGSSAQYVVSNDSGRKTTLVPVNDTVILKDHVVKTVSKQPAYKNKSKERVGKADKRLLPADSLLANLDDSHPGIAAATLKALCDMAIIRDKNIPELIGDTMVVKDVEEMTKLQSLTDPGMDCAFAVDTAANSIREKKVRKKKIKRAAEKLAAIYSTLSIPGIGQGLLLLPDSSKVWANGASSVRYLTVFTDKDRVVEVTGETYFEVRGINHLPFKVVILPVTGKDLVKVLGSHFSININAYDENVIKITLLEGVVKVIKGTGSSVVLNPGQQALVTKSKDIEVLQHVDVGEVVAWKKNE